MLGISLLEIILVVAAFAITFWLIARFVPVPYKRWGFIAVGVFAVIYVLERLHVIELLRSVQI